MAELPNQAIQSLRERSEDQPEIRTASPSGEASYSEATGDAYNHSIA